MINEYLLGVLPMPDVILSTLGALPHFVLKATLWGLDYYQ